MAIYKNGSKIKSVMHGSTAISRIYHGSAIVFDTVAPDIPVDPYWDSVVFLSSFDGVNASTTFTEARNRSLTPYGAAKIDTTQFRFGDASVRFPGAGADRIEAEVGLAIDVLGNQPFTIETGVRFNTLAEANRVIMGVDSLTRAWQLGISSALTEVYFAYSTSGSATTDTLTTSGAAITTGVWYNIVVEREANGTLRIYVDGVMRGKLAQAMETISSHSASRLIFGQWRLAGNGSPMDGWMDETRITKGVARYASDDGFPIPTQPFARLPSKVRTTKFATEVVIVQPSASRTTKFATEVVVAQPSASRTTKLAVEVVTSI